MAESCGLSAFSDQRVQATAQRSTWCGKGSRGAESQDMRCYTRVKLKRSRWHARPGAPLTSRARNSGISVKRAYRGLISGLFGTGVGVGIIAAIVVLRLLAGPVD